MVSYPFWNLRERSCLRREAKTKKMQLASKSAGSPRVQSQLAQTVPLPVVQVGSTPAEFDSHAKLLVKCCDTLLQLHRFLMSPGAERADTIKPFPPLWRGTVLAWQSWMGAPSSLGSRLFLWLFRSPCIPKPCVDLFQNRGY